MDRVRLWDYTREQIAEMASQMTLVVPVAATESSMPWGATPHENGMVPTGRVLLVLRARDRV
jgi:hypothetical protein